MGRVIWVASTLDGPVENLIEIGVVPIGSREATNLELLGELTRQGRLMLTRDETATEYALERVRRSLELSDEATPADIADEAELKASERRAALDKAIEDGSPAAWPDAAEWAALRPAAGPLEADPSRWTDPIVVDEPLEVPSPGLLADLLARLANLPPDVLLKARAAVLEALEAPGARDHDWDAYIDELADASECEDLS